MLISNIYKKNKPLQASLLLLMAMLGGLQCSQAFPDDALALLLIQEAASNEPHYIFVTNSTYQGNLGGVAGADALCQSDAAIPDSSRSYKALISDGLNRVACTSANCSSGSAEGIDWVLKANRPYFRVESGIQTFLARTSSLAIFDLSNGAQLAAALHSSASREWWSGLSTDWQNDPNDCTDWTTNGATSGSTGAGNQTGSAAIGGVNPLCLSNRSLVCVSQ